MWIVATWHLLGTGAFVHYNLFDFCKMHIASLSAIFFRKFAPILFKIKN